MFIPWFGFAGLSALFLAGEMIVQKKVLLREHATEYMAVISIVNLIVALPAIFLIQPVASNLIILIFIKSIFASIFFWMIAKSLRHMCISSHAPLLNISPIFVAILAWIFLGEQMTIAHAFGVLLIVFGAYLLELKNGIKGAVHPFIEMCCNRYFIYLLIALLASAVAILLDKVIVERTDIWTFLFYQRVFIALIFTTIIYVLYDGHDGIIRGFRKYGKWIGAASILYNIGDIFYFRALQLAFVSLVIPIKRMATLIAAVVGGTILSEEGIWRKAAACLIMIAGTALLIFD